MPNEAYPHNFYRKKRARNQTLSEQETKHLKQVQYLSARCSSVPKGNLKGANHTITFHMMNVFATRVGVVNLMVGSWISI